MLSRMFDTRRRHRFALVFGTAVLTACGNDMLRPNTPPTAAFTAACSGLTCTLTDESTDEDGSIEAYAWDFGDGEVGTERHPSHTYDTPGGQFNVTLSVTDDAGEAATTTRQVTVQPDESVAVKASFVFACTVLTCTFTDRSSGPVVSRAWDFGDGEASDQQNPNHTYAEPGGRFNVTLIVKDDRGAESTAAKEVEAMRDLSGTYERVTIHDSPDRSSRIVIRSDGTFELFDWTGTDTLAYPGRWRSFDSWFNMALEPGTAIGLDFDAIAADPPCGEAFGMFLTDAHLAIAFCGPAIEAGLQEGVYSSAPSTGTSVPPPQGGQIAFVRDGRIQRANTDGSGLVQLTEGPDDRAPAWSPDGSRIAFSKSGGSAPGIYVVNADGSHATRLTGAGAESGDPAWSPDGEWIVFVCGPPIQPDSYELCRVGTDGAGADPVRFTAWLTGQVSSPSWSPDGTRIAFTSDWAAFDFVFDIWSIAPDGTQMTALTTHTPEAPNPFEFYQPEWSPDGQRIAYVICPWAWNYCSSSAVSVMNADGTGMTLLVAASGFASPTWSPDGQLIAFASGGSIEWVSADGSQRGLIVDDGHSPSWRP